MASNTCSESHLFRLANPIMQTFRIDSEMASKKIPRRTITYHHDSNHLCFVSPTIIQGDNGVGKSTLAHLLAGAVKSSGGKPEIMTEGLRGSARMLLQNSQAQAFAKSPTEHLNMVFKYDGEKRKSATDSANNLSKTVRASSSSLAKPISDVDSEGYRSSILDTKLTLLAERISTKPVLLIMDEPTWGLSIELACSLISEIVALSHAAGIPVAVISHDSEWLQGIVKSRMNLKYNGAAGEVCIYAENI